MEHPSIISIATPHPRFIRKVLPASDASPPPGHHPLDFLGMNERCPFPAFDVFQRATQVFEPRLIEIIEVAVRSGRMYQAGNRVDNELKALRLSFLFCGIHDRNHNPPKMTYRGAELVRGENLRYQNCNFKAYCIIRGFTVSPLMTPKVLVVETSF